MNYMFYKCDFWDSKYQEEKLSMYDDFKSEIWKPSLFQLYPTGCTLLPSSIWWLMHYFHIFANRDYSLFLIRDDNNLIIHRSVITPRYFRFPFMCEEDLQIGDTWTMPECRGKGLASFAIQKIVELHKKPGRRFWYVVEEDNMPSIGAVEKLWFVKYGVGVRRKRIGAALFGFFEMQQRFL